jgi:hypothetical protein
MGIADFVSGKHIPSRLTNSGKGPKEMIYSADPLNGMKIAGAEWSGSIRSDCLRSNAFWHTICLISAFKAGPAASPFLTVDQFV